MENLWTNKGEFPSWEKILGVSTRSCPASAKMRTKDSGSHRNFARIGIGDTRLTSFWMREYTSCG
jgi:hypothetical protein